MVKFLLESSQKRPLLNMGQGNPLKNGIQNIKENFGMYIVDQCMPIFTFPGTCERGFTPICKKSESWVP